jgi:hypothetical protein
MLTMVTGALAGAFHALAGPDHLAAVAPLAAVRGARGWLAGWTWGVGHTSGVVTVAAGAVLLRDALPPVEALAAWSERLVGGALVAVGLWALGRSLRVTPAGHAHGSLAHRHLHVGAGPRWLRRLGHPHASFCLGVLHGVAGSSHVVGVAPALALPTGGAALLYVAAFGAGTIAAMTAFAAAAGAMGARARRGGAAHRAAMATSALAAIAVGVAWLVAPAR